MQAVLFIFAIFVGSSYSLPHKKHVLPVPKIEINKKALIHEQPVHHHERVILRQEEPVVKIKKVPLVRTRTIVQKRPVVLREPRPFRKDIFITKRIHVPKAVPRAVIKPVYVDKVNTVVRKIPKQVPYDVIRRVVKPIIRRVEKPFDVVKKVFRKVTVHKPVMVDVPEYRKVPRHIPVDVIKREPVEVIRKVEKPVKMEVIQHVPVVQKVFVKERRPVHITKHVKHGVVIPNPVPMMVKEKVDIPVPYPAHKGPIHVTDHTHGIRIKSRVTSRRVTTGGSTSGGIVSVSAGGTVGGGSGVQPDDSDNGGGVPIFESGGPAGNIDNGMVPDACSSNPCGDRGSCTSDSSGSGSGFTCNCFEGFSGRFCQENDACNPNPCMNGGSCSASGSSGFMCSCSSGFTGDMCQSLVQTGGNRDGGTGGPFDPSASLTGSFDTNGDPFGSSNGDGTGTGGSGTASNFRVTFDGQQISSSNGDGTGGLSGAVAIGQQSGGSSFVGNTHLGSSSGTYIRGTSTYIGGSTLYNGNGGYNPRGNKYFKKGRKMVVYGHNKHGMPLGKMV